MTVGSLEAGELWGSLFHGTEMSPAQVILPPGRYFENWQSAGERSLSAENARERLRTGAKWEMTSRYLFGDELEAGTEGERGAHVAELSADEASVSFGGDKKYPLHHGVLFDRDGDLVFRKNTDGYGFEYAFRAVS